MAINYHPEIGTILVCDFHGFVIPEMLKRRPVIVVSPRLRNRDKLCTVVPLSTTEPGQIMPFHYKLILDNPLPPPYDSEFHWVKCDMLATVSFNRLDLPRRGKDHKGTRQYITKTIDKIDLYNIRKCILHALNLCHLTEHL